MTLGIVEEILTINITLFNRDLNRSCLFYRNYPNLIRPLI